MGVTNVPRKVPSCIWQCSLALVLLAQSSIKLDVEYSPKESQDLIAEQIVQEMMGFNLFNQYEPYVHLQDLNLEMPAYQLVLTVASLAIPVPL